MRLNSLAVLFADAVPAAPGGMEQNQTGATIKLVGMMAFFGIAMYLMVFRPQQKRQKEHDLLVKGVKTKDKIETTGGILGEVISVKEKSVTIRSNDAKLEINKAAIARILERGSESSDS